MTDPSKYSISKSKTPNFQDKEKWLFLLRQHWPTMSFRIRSLTFRRTSALRFHGNNVMINNILFCWSWNLCSVYPVFGCFLEQVFFKDQSSSLHVNDLCTAVGSHFSPSMNRIIVTKLRSLGIYIHVVPDVQKLNNQRSQFRL